MEIQTQEVHKRKIQRWTTYIYIYIYIYIEREREREREREIKANLNRENTQEGGWIGF